MGKTARRPRGHTPRHLLRAGLWQAVLMLLTAAIAGIAVHDYAVDLRALIAYQRLPVCAGTGSKQAAANACLSDDRATVVAVTGPGADPSAPYVLQIRCDQDNCDNWVLFADHQPLWDRVRAGSRITVRHDTNGTITRVRYGSMSAPTLYAPTDPWIDLGHLIAFGSLALFFGWRAWIAAGARRRRARQDRVWPAAALLAAGAVVLSIMIESFPEGQDGWWPASYAILGAIAVAAGSLIWPWRRRAALRAAGAGTIEPAPPSGPAAVRRGTGTARSTRTLRSTGTVVQAGGLGGTRMRWLLARSGKLDRPEPAGLVVTALSQPRLVALVAEVAGVLGVDPPDTVLLGPRPEVALLEAVPGVRRRGLSVGLPLALALAPADLRAAVAHELVLLREPRPDLAARLLAARRRCLARVEGFGGGWPGRGSADALWMLARTEAFARDLESRADTAARRARGPAAETAAALAWAAALGRDFDWFSVPFRPTAARPLFPARLYTGWASTLDRPATPDRPILAPDGGGLAVGMRPHTGLTGAAAALDPTVLRETMTIRSDGAVVDVDERTETELARRYYRANPAIGRAAPAAWSGFDAEQWLGDTPVDPRIAAGALLGAPAPAATVLDLVAAGRGAEVAAVWEDMSRYQRTGGYPTPGGWPWAAGREPPPWSGSLPGPPPWSGREPGPRPEPAWRPDSSDHPGWDGDGQRPGEIAMMEQLAVVVLRERGYLFRDVLRPHQLTGPGGDVVDLADLAALDATRDQRLARLRALVSG